MYFKDLTPYSYYLSSAFDQVLNIGWLDCEHDYPIGEVPLEFVANLRRALGGGSKVKSEVNLIRGVHPCNFCGSDQLVDPYSKIGSCEIWIPGENGKIYASPSQIVHYVEAHGYLPPKEFVDAVMNLDFEAVFDGQAIYDKLIGERAGMTC